MWKYLQCFSCIHLVNQKEGFCVVFSHTSLLPGPGSQDSKDELSASARGADGDKPPSMPEETGKSKVASWLTSQGLKKVSTEEIKLRTMCRRTELCVHSLFKIIAVSQTEM